MQTHRDIWFSNGGDVSEWLYFNTRKYPFPVMEFVPYPIAVTGIIFPDGSQQFTAGGGGGAGVSFLAGPGISLTPGIGTMTISNTWPQSPWQSNINANGNSITNLNSINGIPVASLQQTPWVSNINAAQFTLGNIPQIDFAGGANPHTGSIKTDSVGFEIVGGANTAIYLYSPTMIELTTSFCYLAAGGSTGPAFEFETAAGPTLLIMPNGRIGMRQAIPAFQLDVVGDINCTGDFRINGVPITRMHADTDSTPPSSPEEGSFWFDSGNLRLFVRHSNAWFQVSA